MCTYDGITGPLGPILLTGLVLASLGTVIYLGLRLREGTDEMDISSVA